MTPESSIQLGVVRAGTMALVFVSGLTLSAISSAADDKQTKDLNAPIVVNNHDNGDQFTVTVSQFMATVADKYQKAPKGSRIAAAKLTVTNSGKTTPKYDSANLDTSVNDTGGKIYSGAQADLTACPPFALSAFKDFTPGKTVSGCVAFIVPEGIKIQTVQFQPGDGNANSADTGLWTVK